MARNNVVGSVNTCLAIDSSRASCELARKQNRDLHPKGFILARNLAAKFVSLWLNLSRAGEPLGGCELAASWPRVGDAWAFPLERNGRKEWPFRLVLIHESERAIEKNGGVFG